MFTDDQQEETVSKKTYFLLMDNYFLLTYFLIGAQTPRRLNRYGYQNRVSKDPYAPVRQTAFNRQNQNFMYI